MPLNAAGYQALLVSEFFLDPEANPNLTFDIVALLWPKNDDRSFDLTLQYLYTKGDIVRWLLQGNWNRFDWARGDVSKKHSQIFTDLVKLLDIVKADIKNLEDGLIANLTPSTGLILRGGIHDPKLDWRNPYYLQTFRPFWWAGEF